MSNISIEEQCFIEEYPCIYEGNVLCRNCRDKDDCDMRSGKELHMQYFIAGWKAKEKK